MCCVELVSGHIGADAWPGDAVNKTGVNLSRLFSKGLATWEGILDVPPMGWRIQVKGPDGACS